MSAVARRLIGLMTVVALLAAGCTRPEPKPAALAQPTRSAVPAGSVGGACHLLDYDVVAKFLGLTFEVAAASQSATTFSCVLRTRAASYPDLVLTVTPTKADDKVFRSTIMPKGATAVAELGKVAYSAPTRPEDSAGPGVEIGWLTGDRRLIMLRCHLAPGTASELAARLTPKLVSLAVEIDVSSL